MDIARFIIIREEVKVRGSKRLRQDIEVGMARFDQSKGWEVTVREPHRFKIHTFANLMLLCNVLNIFQSVLKVMTIN